MKRSVKPWPHIFSTKDPHSLIVRIRTATAVVRPSPVSHAKQPISAKTGYHSQALIDL